MHSVSFLHSGALSPLFKSPNLMPKSVKSRVWSTAGQKRIIKSTLSCEREGDFLCVLSEMDQNMDNPSIILGLSVRLSSQIHTKMCQNGRLAWYYHKQS